LSLIAPAARIARALAAGTAALLLAYGAADFTLQTLQRIPPARRLPSSCTRVETAITLPSSGLLRFHPGWLWELRPGAQYQEIEVNAYGFRGPAVAPDATRRGVRIAVLGDSATLGLFFGGSEADTWPRALETDLRNCGIESEVLNFGIPCFSAAQGAEWFRCRGREWKPDLLLVTYGAFVESNPVAKGHTDRDEIARSRDWGVRLGHFMERFGLWRYFRDQGSPAAIAPPSNSPALFGVGAAAAGNLSRVPIPQFEAALRDIVEMQRADGHQTALITPVRMTAVVDRRHVVADYDEAIRRVGRAERVPVMEAGEYFHRIALPGASDFIPESDLFADLYHPSQAGAQRLAAFLTLELRRLGDVAPAGGHMPPAPAGR
jgi:lysophospholipase L1-like esterase